jgi:MraZ protein
MFLGDYQHTLDAKGRVSLPAKFRAEMTGKLVVAKGFEGCLYIYSKDEYDRFIERLLATEDFDPSRRRVRRFFTTGAFETELDSAGRVSLPGNLREFASLKKDVAVTGNANRIELWDSANWSEYNSGGEDQGSIEDLAKELAAAGLL